jgi:Flp pilus assembly protein TadD
VIKDRKARLSAISVLFLCTAIVAAAYSNTLDVPWYLDDFANISENPSIHISSLDVESLMRPVRHSLEKGRLDRPLARFSFALNWYFGKHSPEGYHAVNILIHILTTFMLFLTARALFRTPNLNGSPQEDVDFICLLGTVLWALNPIQTQAVTYIVQRMASMVAMFYVTSMYFYVMARFSESRRKQLGYYALCVFSFLMGLASKENAILLPLALFALELIFFQDVTNPRVLKRFGGIALIGGGLVLVFGAWLFIHGNLESILHYGDTRPFSPLERILSQPRVILFYLIQIFYPVPTRLSLEHDVAVSTSLFHPWTTLPSIVAICALIAFAVLRIRRQPLLSFAVLFFFINHAIESSIIGLELIFEHRNYLPSMFLFFPVAWGLKLLLNHYRKSSRLMAGIIAAFSILLVVGMGMGSFIRNQVWGSPRSLWEDAAAKAPRSGRPLLNLAWSYYEKIGDYTTALRLYSKALDLTWTNNLQEQVLLNNLASLRYMGGDYTGAAFYWRRAFEKRSDYIPAGYRLSLALLRSGDIQGAQDAVMRVLKIRPDYSKAINQEGILMLQQQRYSDAKPFFKKAMRSPATAVAATLNMGVAQLLSGDVGRAEFYFKYALFRFPDEKNISLLWLAVLEAQSADSNAEGVWMSHLIAAVKLPDILAWVPKGKALQLYRDSIVLPGRIPSFTTALASQVYRIAGMSSKGTPHLLVVKD